MPNYRQHGTPKRKDLLVPKFSWQYNPGAYTEVNIDRLCSCTGVPRGPIPEGFQKGTRALESIFPTTIPGPKGKFRSAYPSYLYAPRLALEMISLPARYFLSNKVMAILYGH